MPSYSNSFKFCRANNPTNKTLRKFNIKKGKLTVLQRHGRYSKWIITIKTDCLFKLKLQFYGNKNVP